MDTTDTVEPKRSPRKLSWDILRVAAVLGVVVGHITRQSPINHPELGPYPFVQQWQFGASTLLVVSAYFACVTVRRGRTRRWLGHRLARLLPAYLFAVVVTYLTLQVFAPGFGWYVPDTTDLVANLLMVQAWSPDFHWIDGSYWTLPAQVLAFTAAALLAPRRWLRGGRLVGLLWALVVGPIVLRVLFRDNDPAPWFAAVFDGLAMHRVALFGVGVAIWLWVHKRLSTGHLACYAVVVLVAQDAHGHFRDTPSTIAFGIALLAVAAAAGGPDWDIPGVRALARPITWLGGISFGVYLVHQELGFVLARLLLDAGVGPVGRIVACLILAVVAGWGLTRLVERPVHGWLTGAGPARAWQGLRTTAAAASVALRNLPQVPDQPQEPTAGGSPLRPSVPPRPVSHASTADDGPLTSREPLPATRS